MVSFTKKHLFDVAEKVEDTGIDIPCIPRDVLVPELIALARGERKNLGDRIEFFEGDFVISVTRNEECHVSEYFGTFTGSLKTSTKLKEFQPKSREELEQHLDSLSAEKFVFADPNPKTEFSGSTS